MGRTGKPGGDSGNLATLFIVTVGVLVFGGGGLLLGYRRCCVSSSASGEKALAGQDWTAAGAGDTFGDELQGGGEAAPVLGIAGRLRLMMRRMRRGVGGANEGIAMGRTMQFHTLEDF